MRHRSSVTAQVRIRPCQIRDVAAVLALWKRAAAAPSVTDRPAALRGRLRRDRALFLLAWDGSRLVGTIIGGWDGWRASMARLAVDPDYRGRGIGRALVRRVERSLRTLGARRVSGIVLRDNDAGRGFWTSVGYRVDSTVVRYVKDLR
jgi:ribosomal protein S18 acetylase RimI-like enzyme